MIGSEFPVNSLEIKGFKVFVVKKTGTLNSLLYDGLDKGCPGAENRVSRPCEKLTLLF
jgi:hypothetical protein